MANPIFEYTDELIGASARQTTSGFEIIKTVLASSGDNELVLGDLSNTPFAMGTPHPLAGYLGVKVVDLNVVPMAGDKSLVTVIYRNEQKDFAENTDGEIWEWDFTSEQQHITSVETEAKQTHFPASEDVGVGIGIDGDDIHGTDVLRPAETIRVTLRVAEADLQSKRDTIATLRATVNSATWKGYTEGEVLFQSAHISKEKSDGGVPETKNWRIDYNFIVRRARGETPVDTTSGTVQIDPDPWDHVWFKHIEKEEDGIKRTLIESVHIAKTQDRGQFAAFDFKGGNF